MRRWNVLTGSTTSGSRIRLVILYALLALGPLGLGVWMYGGASANPAVPWLGHRFQDWTSFAGLWGSYVTVVGLGVALDQLRQVKTQAQAATDAAREAGEDAATRLSLGEYGRAAPLCDQASEAIGRGELREAEARLRLARVTVSSAKKMADVLGDAQLSRNMQDVVARVSLVERSVAAAEARGEELEAPALARDDLKSIELELDAMYADQRFSFGGHE